MGDQIKREELVMRYQGLVRSIATSLAVSLPPKTDFEDLLSYGQIGLAEAAAEYDESLGVKFSTFSYYRIRGAILDGAYQMSWYSRTYAKKLKQQRLAIDALRTQRLSTEEQDDLLDTATSVVRLMVVGLAIDAGDSSGSFEEILEDDSANRPDYRVQDSEATQLLREAVSALPDEEREFVQALYYRGETLTSIAKRNGRDKWWASRLHDKTLNLLAKSLCAAGFTN